MDGVSVLNVENAALDSVTVRIVADSHNAAFAWRTRIASSEGVDRVVTFDFIQGTEYEYEAQLVSGGG